MRSPAVADLERLAQRLGSGRVAWGADLLERYAADESTRLRALPEAVVRPRSTEEVAIVLRWASEGPFAVIPRGAGTGVAGGAVAVGGGVVLSLERLDRVLELDEENLTVTCEPAVVTGRLHEVVEAQSLFYPPDPASLASCSIGGNVAVGAGGARAVKYGTTRNYVLGAQVVLADGSVLELGSKNVKDASGYHLLDLLVGSEGTLAVITRVTLRLVPLPSYRAVLLLPFADLKAATTTVARLVRARIVPSVAEFMDDVTIDAARRYLDRDLPGGSRAGAYALIELDGESRSLLEEQMLRVGEVGEQEGALEVLAAQDAGQQERLWESRRCLAEALRALSPEIGKADVVVPRARVPILVDEVKKAGLRHGLVAACFGHAGDGNVHVNFLRQDLDERSWSDRLPQALAEVLEATRRLGGLPSGEHGIGVLKRPDLARFLPSENLEIMRRVKRAFDPLGILNPGKVL
ncbi:MAG: FAD-binding protein [Deltaproteobacteria bacterium]|nr:FAD-binding protein [Deltaproteobacteria bacterium]